MSLMLRLELVDGSMQEISVDETCAPINKDDEFIEFIEHTNCLQYKNEIEEVYGLTFYNHVPKNNDTIKKVVVPFGVTSLREFAFCRCMELEEIILPDSLEEFGPCCFKKCLKLKKVNIPPKTKKIGSECFIDCVELEDIEIPENVEIIETLAFCNCQKLRNIIIPDSVKSLGYGCFKHATNLETVVIKNIETIGEECFCVCKNLKRVVINGPIKTIGWVTFCECKNLESVEFPDTLNVYMDKIHAHLAYEMSVFAGCKKLKEVKYHGKTYHSEEEIMKDVREYDVLRL